MKRLGREEDKEKEGLRMGNKEMREGRWLREGRRLRDTRGFIEG